MKDEIMIEGEMYRKVEDTYPKTFKNSRGGYTIIAINKERLKIYGNDDLEECKVELWDSISILKEALAYMEDN